MKKLVISLLIFSFIFLFSSETRAVQEGGWNEWVEKILTKIKEKWKEEVIPIYEKMWMWFKENIWSRFFPLLKSEYEKRKPEMKEELQKETQEIKKELLQYIEKTLKKFFSSFKK